MSKRLLQFDFSNSKGGDDEDIIDIRLTNGDVIHVNFSNLVKRSKYVRSKYNYSEAQINLQREINELENKYQIKPEIIKQFFELIQQQKASIPIEYYNYFYTLSKYFSVQQFLQELDRQRDNYIFKDLSLTVEILIGMQSSANSIESKMITDIEAFLSTKVNESIEIERFLSLPISTVYRIIDKSDKEEINQDLLAEFIMKDIDKHFILFKFIDMSKMSEDKIGELFEKIESEEEGKKEKYIQYIPFNYSFIKQMRANNEQLLNELKQTKILLCESNKEKEEIKEKLNKEKEELERTKILLCESNKEKEEIKEKLDEREEELKRAQAKARQDQGRNEIEGIRRENEGIKAESASDKIEKKHRARTIIVGGVDNSNQLDQKPNNKNGFGTPVISPPLKSSLDSSSLLSYSTYGYHSVLVTSSGSLQGIGDNEYGRIRQFTDFSINDDSGGHLAAVSAVCSFYGTLYMLSKDGVRERQLVYCDCDINGGSPVFLDIGGSYPVSLFGGCSHSAAISDKGEVIFINRESVKKSPKTAIVAVSLPGSEKASSVACLKESVVVLSSNGRLFSSSISSGSIPLNFSAVTELEGEEIVSVSGTHEHCLAVNKEGRVFGRGSNSCGQLGLGERTESAASFTKISSLEGYRIRSAYAGGYHSLFETREGKILSCGSNFNGELLLESDPGSSVYSPRETTIKSGATFCIAGNGLSSVFIDGDPPPNTPNMRIHLQ